MTPLKKIEWLGSLTGLIGAALLALQAGFTTTSVLGIYRWLG